MSRVVLSGTPRGVASLALLAVLVACSDQQPTGLIPSVSLSKNGQGRSQSADLTMTGGLTASEQAVHVQNGRNRLQAGADEEDYLGARGITYGMALNATHAAGVGACVTEARNKAVPDYGTLFDKLVDGPRLRRFWVDIDETAVGGPSEDSGIEVNWEDADGTFSVSLGRLSPLVPGTSVVTMTGDLAAGLTVTFTGGSIRLRNWTGNHSEYYNVTCPLDPADAITMVLISTSP